MRIEIEIPDWVEPERVIRIFAGMDLVASKLPNEKWKVKVEPCNMCGECCIEISCEHLGMDGDKRPCDLVSTGEIPFICAASMARHEKYKNCSVRFEEQ